MAGLKETKRRIQSVKNTQKITRAMKLVSSAKYARAHQSFVFTKPYRDTLEEALTLGVARGLFEDHAFLASPDSSKIAIILLTSDRGLCGGLNSSLVKYAENQVKKLKSNGSSVDVYLWGKKGSGLVRAGGFEIKDRREKILEKPSYSFAKEKAFALSRAFVSKEYREVRIIFPRFVTALTQEPTLLTLLPLDLGALRNEEEKENVNPASDLSTLIEEDRTIEGGGASDALLNRALAFNLYRCLLEASVSEHAARMTAMDNATSNADNVIRDLTLEYNRERQALITTELIEITSGAEAL